MQQMQKGGGLSLAKTTTSPYLYDPAQHSLENAGKVKDEEPAVPPRGRGRSRKNSTESRKVEQQKQRRAREEHHSGMGVQGTGSASQRSSGAVGETDEVDEKFAAVFVDDGDSNPLEDGAPPAPAPSPLGQVRTAEAVARS